MIFHNPLIFVLIPVVLLAIWFAHKSGRPAGIRFSSGELVSHLAPSAKVRLSNGLIFLRVIAVVLFLAALARPVSPIADSRVQSEGIDIVLALDCSTSMLAEDFIIAGKRRNRLEVVKSVVKDFIKARANDRIAVVAFAARAYTICPLTLDHGWLLENIERIKTGMIEDGTAVGLGLASALNRIRDTQAKSRIVILLTDGRNNAGNISPQTAAEAAQALKVKVYTIGAGTKGMAPYPVKDFFGNTVYQPVQIDIDEDTLVKIAQATNARYFRASDTESLRNIYKEIDRLEKTVVEEKGYLEYNELFACFLIPALCLLALEIILTHSFVRVLP